MQFQEYLDNAWSIHSRESEKLINEFPHHFQLVKTSEDIVSLANLITHVSGEHLGKWKLGIQLLKELENNPLLKDKKSLSCFIAILSMGDNPDLNISVFSYSEQVRILAILAAALVSQHEINRASKYLKQAHQVAQLKIPKEDAANKALAISANNMAITLEEKLIRGKEELELMVEAAFIGRKFWEIAGTWKEIEMAEYRLANTFIKTGEFDRALYHAEICLKIVRENNNIPLEVFFAYEVLARVMNARRNQMGFINAKEMMANSFEHLNLEDRVWCRSILDNL